MIVANPVSHSSIELIGRQKNIKLSCKLSRPTRLDCAASSTVELEVMTAKPKVEIEGPYHGGSGFEPWHLFLDIHPQRVNPNKEPACRFDFQ